jgi:hypothetical protein
MTNLNAIWTVDLKWPRESIEDRLLVICAISPMRAIRPLGLIPQKSYLGTKFCAAPRGDLFLQKCDLTVVRYWKNNTPNTPFIYQMIHCQYHLKTVFSLISKQNASISVDSVLQ